MKAPQIIGGSNNPVSDGAVNLYTSQEGAEQGWFNRVRRIIFVNGMDNKPVNHAQSALALSLLQGCPVIGVYNQIGGFLGDIAQCITDKLSLAGPQMAAKTPLGVGFEAYSLAVDAGFKLAKLANPSLQKVDFVATIIAGNPATYALYGLLAGMGGVDRKNVPIYCHSQGNLITSNALTAVALALGTDAIDGIEVNSFGSPCSFWPSKLIRTNYAYTFDPVSVFFDPTFDMSSVKVGFKVAHGFDTYMKQEGEFLVNRFRFGGFGMTSNMDEKGLARFCVRNIDNPPRLRRIFERLRENHFTDSDDVAVHFVEQASDYQLRTLKMRDPKLIELLIRLLNAGYTASDESRAITRLKQA